MDNSPKILVAGSDASWRRQICNILSNEGHRPYPVASQQEVSQILQQQSFDVAVVDPVLDAPAASNQDDLDMLRLLRDENPDVQIILISDAMPNDTKETVKTLYPAVPFLSKTPWDKNHFTSLIRAYAGEGPNTDDRRMRAMLERSRYGTRPLKPPETERGVGRPRVLCVEGRQDWQRILTEYFNTEDYFWRMVVTEDQAWQMLENESFHLVILNDYILSVRDTGITSQLLDYLVTFRPKTEVLILGGQIFPIDLTKTFIDHPNVSILDKQTLDLDAIKSAVTRAIHAPKLKIESFGPFKIWRDGNVITQWQDQRAETLIKILLSRQAMGGQAVSIRELTILLWGSPGMEAYKHLSMVINAARLALEPNIDPMESSFIMRNSTGFSFDISGNVEWDVQTFRELMRQGTYLIDTQQWGKALTTLKEAHQLYKDDYLADDGNVNWVIRMRNQLNKEHTSVLTDLADVYAAHAQYKEAISVCSEALVNDPLVESVYRRLMRFYYWQGQKDEALKTYRICVKLFEDLFGESPKPITRQLCEAIQNDEKVPNTLIK